MNTDLFDPEGAHRLGESATRPIEPPWSALAGLQLLAGSNQQRRLALPAHPMTAHSGASNCRF